MSIQSIPDAASPHPIAGEIDHVNAFSWTAGDGTSVTIRPIRPSDLTLEQEFVNALSHRTAYQRLLSARSLSPEEVRRFTEIDVEREFALIATVVVAGAEREIGVARYVKNPASDAAEFAIVLSDDWQRRGLGRRLLAHLIDVAKQHGVRRLFGTTLSENRAMIALARTLGFAVAMDRDIGAMTNLALEL